MLLWAPWLIPVAGTAVRDALITIDGGLVTGIQQRVSRDDARRHGARCFDDCVLSPGFVNAHCHIEYAGFRNLGDGLNFPDWIVDHIGRKRRLNEVQVAASARLGAWESVQGGITCIGDGSFSGDAVPAAREVGLRGRVYREVFGDDSLAEERFAGIMEVVAGDAGSGANTGAAADGDGGARDILSIGISPHAPYTAGEQLFRRVASSGFSWMTHAGESLFERDAVMHGSGALGEMLSGKGIPVPVWSGAPLAVIADVLSPRALVVHAIHLDDAEVEAVGAAGAAVVTCPRSNARLGCGVLDVARLQRAGICVALGTDSPASAGAIDMFAEMRCLIETQRAHHADAGALGAAQALDMCTRMGARALGLPGLGTVEVGGRADLMATAVGTTTHPVESLVFDGSPDAVQCVIIEGEERWAAGWTNYADAQEVAGTARTLLELPLG